MKRLFKIFVWIAGIMAVLLVLAFIALKIFLPMDKIKAMAIEEGSKALGREVIVEGIDISIWGGLGVQLEGVFVANPDSLPQGNFLSANSVDVKLKFWPLLSGDFALDRLIVNTPRITMFKQSDGSNNYTFESVDKQLPPTMAENVPAEAKTAAAAVTFDRLEIRDGVVDFVDDSSDISIHLGGFSLMTSLETIRQAVYHSSGQITVDTLLVTIEESLPALAIEIDYNAEFDMGQNRLVIKETDLKLNGLGFKLTGDVIMGPGATSARGNIKSRSIAVTDLLKLIPGKQLEAMEGFSFDGDFALDADLNYDQNGLSYSGTATITDMTMTSDEISGQLKFSQALLDFEPDNLRINIEDGTFDGRPLKGLVAVADFENPQVNGELAGSLNLAFVQPFLPAEYESELAGELDFSVKFSGLLDQPESIDFSGQVAVPGGSLSSNLLPEPIESFRFDAYFDNCLTRVNVFEATIPSGNVSFEGRINNLMPYLMADSSNASQVTPSVDGRLKGKVGLSMLTAFLPAEGNPEVGGVVEFDILLAGDATKASNFKPQGTLTIADAYYRDSLLPESIEHLSTSMTISPDTISISSLILRSGSAHLDFKGKLMDPFPYLLPLDVVDRTQVTRPMFVFVLKSNRLDLDQLFPEAVPGSGTNRASLPADSVPPFILPDIDGRGSFQIDTLIYSQVEFTDIKGRVRIENKNIECWDVNGMAYTGKVKGRTTIDLNDFENPRYTGEFEASGIEADDFVSRFSKFGGHLFGKMDFSGSYDAEGWEPEQFLNALTLDGFLKMREGMLKTSGSVSSSINSLAQKAGKSFDKQQVLKDLASAIKIEDGKVKIDAFKTGLGNIGDISLDGFYSFSGELAYTGSVFLSESLTSELLSQNSVTGALGKLLGGNSTKRIKLPLSIGGTIDKPKVNLDIMSALKEGSKGTVKDALNDLFGN